MIDLFWKFHTKKAFNALKNKVRIEKLLYDKNKIEGAYL